LDLFAGVVRLARLVLDSAAVVSRFESARLFRPDGPLRTLSRPRRKIFESYTSFVKSYSCGRDRIVSGGVVM